MMQSDAHSAPQPLRTRVGGWFDIFCHVISGRHETSFLKMEERPGQTSSPSTAFVTAPNGKKILVVDDNPVIIKTLSFKLKAAGYTVISALDGGEAVSSTRKEKPDLILLDINFPPDVSHGGGVPWDGFLIMNWVRRMDEAKHVPIIIITSGDPAKYKDRALAEGAHSFFHKPIEMQELMTTVQKILGTEPPKATPAFDI
jgi:CheY-like chemotaxis protein